MRAATAFTVVFVALVLASAAATKEARDPLPVVYQRQQDRTLCQSATVSMFLSFVGKRDVSQQEIKKGLIKLGGQYLHSSRVKLLQTYLPKDHFEFRYVPDKDVAWKEIAALLRDKVPVIMSTKLTASGHVILVVGSTEQNGDRRLIVHDPWGKLDPKTRKYDSKDGQNVSYPFSELAIRSRLVKGTSKGKVTSFRETYCSGTQKWLTAKRRAEIQDAKVVEEKAEWVYIRPRLSTRGG